MKAAVSVAMAVYNGEEYLREQIDSIICQLRDEDELVVSVDPCGDRSKEIALDYAKQDKRIKVYDGPGRGVVFNFENAIKHTKGDYILLSDQDDVWESDKIALTLDAMTQIEAESAEGSPLLVFTDLMVADAEMNMRAPSFMRFSKLDGKRTALNQLLIQNVVTGCTAMFNASLKELFLACQTKDHILMHDWWLALIASAFGRIRYIDTATVKYRQHDKNVIGAKNTRSIRYLFSKMYNNNDIRRSIIKTTLQAKRFVEAYGNRLSADQRCMIKGYADLYERGKLGRLWFMLRQGILKYGFMRKAAQMIWG